MRLPLHSYLLLLLLLCACATTPRTVNESLAVGYSTLAAVRTVAANGLNAKILSVADAKQVQLLADEARTGLDAARALNLSGDTSTAIAKLNFANGILVQLQQYLTARGIK